MYMSYPRLVHVSQRCIHTAQKPLSISWTQFSRRTRCSSIACRASNLEPPDIRKLAKLAQMHVTDEEVADWEPKLKQIVGWLDKLQEIDVSNVSPTARVSFENSVAAGNDVPVDFPDKEKLMDAVPQREGPYVKVPKIL